MRLFLAGLARRVRAGVIEVHAYCLMGTHYHLLVRSPEGRLAEAMQSIQLGYSRYFNRSRKRDGSLVRGRYRSKPVQSYAYRRALVAYIDGNPVEARLVDRAELYPYGSAFHYCGRRSGPAWLERSWIEGEVERATSSLGYSPASYGRVFGPSSAALRHIVEARIEGAWLRDPLDDLLSDAPGRVLDWMRRRAALADGTKPGIPVTDLRTVNAVVDAAARDSGRPMESPGEPGGWDVARAALARDLCGASLQTIASRLGCSDTRVGKLLDRHRRSVLEDPRYADQIERLVRESLREYGTRFIPQQHRPTPSHPSRPIRGAVGG